MHTSQRMEGPRTERGFPCFNPVIGCGTNIKYLILSTITPCNALDANMKVFTRETDRHHSHVF